MKQIECLLEELPTQAEVRRKLRSDLPVVLEIDGDVILFEGNHGVPLGYIDSPDTLKEVVVVGESKRPGRAGQEGVGGVLIVELTAEGDSVTTEAPGSVVLRLTHFDDTTLGIT